MRTHPRERPHTPTHIHPSNGAPPSRPPGKTAHGSTDSRPSCPPGNHPRSRPHARCPPFPLCFIPNTHPRTCWMPSASASVTAPSNHLVRASMKLTAPGTPHSGFSNVRCHEVGVCRARRSRLGKGKGREGGVQGCGACRPTRLSYLARGMCQQRAHHGQPHRPTSACYLPCINGPQPHL